MLHVAIESSSSFTCLRPDASRRAGSTASWAPERPPAAPQTWPQLPCLVVTTVPLAVERSIVIGLVLDALAGPRQLQTPCKRRQVGSAGIGTHSAPSASNPRQPAAQGCPVGRSRVVCCGEIGPNRSINAQNPPGCPCRRPSCQLSSPTRARHSSHRSTSRWSCLFSTFHPIQPNLPALDEILDARSRLSTTCPPTGSCRRARSESRALRPSLCLTHPPSAARRLHLI